MNENNFTEKFKKAWANPKYKAAIKLGLYLIAMVIICVIVAVGSRMKVTDNGNEEETKTVTYTEKLAALKANNYAYVYEVNKYSYNDDYTISKTIKTIFTGVKLNKRELGYKESADETIKYYIDTETYIIVFGEKAVTNDLYKGINSNLIDTTALITKIESLKGTWQQTNGEEYYTYIDVLTNQTINVYYSKTKITKITIDAPEYGVTLKFTKIGEITESDLTF
jgi:hypothetical protein